MPIVRSRSPVPSGTEEEGSMEIADWSTNAPESTATRTSASTVASAETSTGTSVGTSASRHTIVAAASAALGPAAPAQGRVTRAASAAAAAAAPPPRTASETIFAQTRASRQPPPRAILPETTPASVRPATAYPPASAAPSVHPVSVSAPASAHPALVFDPVAQAKVKKGTKILKDFGGRPAAPPFAPSGVLVPQVRDDARSTRSSKRMELEARRELQKKQLEVAQTAAALAQTELELTQCLSEEEIDDEYEVERATNVEHWVEQTTTCSEDPKITEVQPTQKSEIKELADAIINATRSVQPVMTASTKMWDLPDFNGAHEEWLPFKRAYEDSSALCTVVHNMARLRKAVKGTAKEAIRSLLFVASDPKEVIDALERRFGRPEQLVLAELQKIKELPRIGDTPRDICVFSSRVSNAVTTINALNKPHYLYSPEMSRSIIEKLTPILRYRWLDFSARIGDEEPELLKIKKFLEVEADLCGKIAPPELPKKRFGNSRHAVHATQEEDEDDDDDNIERDTVATTSEGYKKFCMHCEGEHWLIECKKFKEASTNERWNIVVKKHLCFKCLRRRHTRMNCRGQPCKKCKRPHHILLHSESDPRKTTPSTQQDKPSSSSQSIEKEDTTNVVKSVYAAADGTRVYLKMIPVDIYGPKGSTRVLALLDEGSTVSLMDKDIACRIGATGREQSLILETVGGKIIEKSNSQVMDLKIKGAQRRDKRTLRGVRTIEHLKLAPQYVSKKAIEECSHLRNIKNEVLYEKERPMLLIGQDNWDLIISRKILKGKLNEPVASLTSLGWVLHGRHAGSVMPVECVNHCYAVDYDEAVEEMSKDHSDLDSVKIQKCHPSNDAEASSMSCQATGLETKQWARTKEAPNKERLWVKVTDRNCAPEGIEMSSAVTSTVNPIDLVAPAPTKRMRLIQDERGTGVKWNEVVGKDQRVPKCFALAAGEIHNALMAGKARMAFEESTYIPRLKLQAALRGAKPTTAILEESDLNLTLRVFRFDSTTVLQWMKADPRRFKSFVAHRLAAIEELTKPREWRWVPTKNNPADDATRNVPKNFDSKARWFTGPEFLYQPKSDWPVKEIKKEDLCPEEIKKATCTTTRTIQQLSLPDPGRFSSWMRLLRTTARMYMFIDMCRRDKSTESVTERKSNKEEKRRWLPIEPEHLNKAEKALIRQSQGESFKNEIDSLKKKKPIDNSSRLKKIDVALDTDGVLRLNSRTSKINYGEKNLPILDGRSRMPQLLVEHYHRHLHHGNHATVMNELQQKYWVLSLRDTVRKVAHQCQWCRIRRTKPEMPPLGDLPIERLAHHQPPFTCTGVDYFGPMHVTIGRRREKRWGALFTCLTTRAVHLELAASLSTSSMIMALRRMASRRGSPRIIFSDNGTNFVGADHELRAEMKKLQRKELIEAAENEGFHWKFIPPGAPNMGGAWERLVRSVKTALATVLRERNPPEEVLHTLLTEVEHTVNSRLLTHLNADPGEEEALTPNHFLIGRSCGAATLGEFDDSETIGRPNWRTAQRLADHFWNRWLKEYLPALMPRKMNNRKSLEFCKGDVVIIADSSLPRNTWPRGVIEETFQGPDQRTRIVNVRTRGGIMKRPTSRLILVTPVKTLQPVDGVPGPPCTGGENVSNVLHLT